MRQIFSTLTLITISAFLLFFQISCKKGQTFRFGDQDLFALGAQESCHFNRNNLGVRVSWKGSMPLNLIIHNSVPEKYDADIISAAQRWNTAKGKTLITVRRDNGFDQGPGKDRQNVIYWMNSWDGPAQEQARTSISIDLSRIIDADIKINALNFKYGLTAQSSTSTLVNLESLVVHEMGHALGLTHFDEAGVMVTKLPAAKVRVEPTPFEISELSCEY